MEFTLYTAALTGAEANCRYPERRKISCAEDLEAAVAFDHVCVAFKNDYRKRENFLSSDVLVMDCDNSHTENPAEWKTMEKFLAMMPEVAMAIVPSRNHMKPKDGKCARPRFHVYFEIPEITDEPCYTELKRAVYHAYPFFDEAALDAARFIYGCPAEKVLWQNGKMTIDQVLKAREAGIHSIPQGQRNNTMSRFAGRVIKRYGATERAYSIFLEEAEKCDPPLADAELNKIWQSAVRFGEKIARQDGYISPDQYNNDFARQGSLKPEDYSDIGQAKVLKREYGDELRYTENTDFLRYNGIYWAESHQEAIGAAEEFLELQLADARDQMEAGRKALQEMGVAAELIDKGGRMLEKVIEGSQQKAFQSYQAALAYYAFVMKRRDMRYIISALQALKPMLLIPIQALDADEFLLNTPSFTYDLRQGMAGRRNHRPEDYITTQDYSFTASNRSPVVRSFDLNTDQTISLELDLSVDSSVVVGTDCIVNLVLQNSTTGQSVTYTPTVLSGTAAKMNWRLSFTMPATAGSQTMTLNVSTPSLLGWTLTGRYALSQLHHRDERDKEVFHTSFEDMAEGTESPSAKTGERVLSSTYSVDLRNFIPGSYLLSYWESSDNGASWQRVQQMLEVTAASTNHELNAAGKFIDEVRIQPTGSEMTTYTHLPGIGMTSQTDPNGHTVYYEYDALGRLSTIRDNERRLLKSYQYE